MKYLPSFEQLTKQTILTVAALIAAGLILSRFPTLKNLIDKD